MNEQLMQRFRHRLETMGRSIRDDVESIQEVTFQASGGQVAGEISNAPMHLGDRGTEEYLNQLSSTLLSHEESLSNEVQEALERLENGRFGLCETCGKEIAIERLEALPFAKQCIHCASKGSSTATPNINEGRPLTPADTMAPEGEMAESRKSARSAFTESNTLFADEVDESGDHAADTHAVGTPGGGDALGGLAGSNVGRGDPQVAELEDSMGSGTHDPTVAGKQIERPRDRR
jgi:RNA polymerase-binding protein DksA